MTCNSWTKPGYSSFYSTYQTQIQNAANGTNIPQSAIASQWYDEWGIPDNNPGFQISSMGYCTNGSCGSFPNFCTLDTGVSAYIAQINYSYNGTNAHPDIFGRPTNIAGAYNTGFPGGLTATNVPTDDGTKVTATSQAYYGLNNLPDPFTAQQFQYYKEQGAQAAMEQLGASPWDGGHYMKSTDTTPGQKLINIAIDSGWLSSLS